MWQFLVEVIDGNIRRTFTSQTDVKWEDFIGEVLHHFERPRNEVQVGYRISGDSSATMSYLASEFDWKDAITRLLGKVRSARTRAVSMEIKNMVSHVM